MIRIERWYSTGSDRASAFYPDHGVPQKYLNDKD